MQNFIAEDEISKEILNSAKLLQAVQVNALILGKAGTGKTTILKPVRGPIIKRKASYGPRQPGYNCPGQYPLETLLLLPIYSIAKRK